MDKGVLNYLNKTDADRKELHFWTYVYRYIGKKAYVNEIIKNNIGLRLQSKLTKEQAKFVAACNSVHKDISLNF